MCGAVLSVAVQQFESMSAAANGIYRCCVSEVHAGKKAHRRRDVRRRIIRRMCNAATVDRCASSEVEGGGVWHVMLWRMWSTATRT